MPTSWITISVFLMGKIDITAAGSSTIKFLSHQKKKNDTSYSQILPASHEGHHRGSIK